MHSAAWLLLTAQNSQQKFRTANKSLSVGGRNGWKSGEGGIIEKHTADVITGSDTQNAGEW